MSNEIFIKFGVNVSHDVWDEKSLTYAKNIYEIINYRQPVPAECTIPILAKAAELFLERANAAATTELMFRPDYGMLYLTAKRIIYKQYK